jgi:hypothetical protein
MTISAVLKSYQSVFDRTSQIHKHLSMAAVLKIEDGAWHGLIEPNGEFPPEKGRYHLYIGERGLAYHDTLADFLLQAFSAPSHTVPTLFGT